MTAARRSCWFFAGMSAAGMFVTDRPVAQVIFAVIAIAWLRLARIEADRAAFRRRWL